MSLGSCTMALTNKLWSKKTGYEEIESFFLDKEERRVVLIGEAGYKLKEGTDHYSITDKTGQIYKVFEIGVKSESGIFINLNDPRVRGSKIGSSMGWVAYGMNNLTKEDKEFLNTFNVSPGKKKYGDFGYYFARDGISKIVRYKSSEEKFTNICSETNKNPDCSPIIKLARPWKGPMRNVDTWTTSFAKLLVTPFTAAIDMVILTPINAVIYIQEYRPGGRAQREATGEL